MPARADMAGVILLMSVEHDDYVDRAHYDRLVASLKTVGIKARCE